MLVLSDRFLSSTRALIPDMMAVAAVRKHLEQKGLMQNVSIVMDSYQAIDPHQTAALLAVGASAVYARGAYEKIADLAASNPEFHKGAAWHSHQYAHALKESLLKIMGKMGIVTLDNYINGNLIAALGLNLADPAKGAEELISLADIFKGIYSPIKGIHLGHIALAVAERHYQAFDFAKDMSLLPHSGYYRPEHEGLKHGYGPEVINAFTAWMKAEDITYTRFRIHQLLKKQGITDFAKDEEFTREKGFLDPNQKDKNGFYPASYLERFCPSPAFEAYTKAVESYRAKHPTSLSDLFAIDTKGRKQAVVTQSQEAIRALFSSGGMSQGALTVADPTKPEEIKAHETIVRAMNAIGAMSGAGEGGEALKDMKEPLKSASSKQVASGRFGVSALQVLHAKEIEIKVAQGAKPGEGGQLPGAKVSIRFAAQRHSIPGVDLISPPPHHDIYSIEDLQQLIYDIKSVNPNVKVAVKLVASEGIGTIAVGVAKAGADVINVASHSGGTGAAALNSIKHAGLASEIGVAEVYRALHDAKLAGKVQIRASGGMKTADDVLKFFMLGASLIEWGTTTMLTQGCKMQRTCNLSCEPGITTDGHKFKGQQLNTERFFVQMAAEVHQRLGELGFSSLDEIRGRTDLLQLIDPELANLYDFSPLLKKPAVPFEPYTAVEELTRKDDECIQQIEEAFTRTGSKVFENEQPILLNTQHRSFGARIATLAESKQGAKITVRTKGNAGQSYGFVNPKGVMLRHEGPVQDGLGKSMTGGKIVVRAADKSASYKAAEHTLAGNAAFYGASGGEAFVEGGLAHRAAILLKGATIVAEKAGDFAFEYATDGTGMILGEVGNGFGTGASGGIFFLYNPNAAQNAKLSPSVRLASNEEQAAYGSVIKTLLTRHYEETESEQAKKLLAEFNPQHFSVVIPVQLDNIKSLKQVADIFASYQLRASPISPGMQIWLEQKAEAVLKQKGADSTKEELAAFIQSLKTMSGEHRPISESVRAHLLKEAEVLQAFNAKPSDKAARDIRDIEDLVPAKTRSVEERLSSPYEIVLDTKLLDILGHITAYVQGLVKDAGGCSTCWAQSCSGVEVETGCPEEKPINSINAKLQQLVKLTGERALTANEWQVLREAFELQTKRTPFIAYTGAACPAPCQDACTESIPDKSGSDPKRQGKETGNPVQIKDIEYLLYQLGRFMGWFDGKKEWAKEDTEKVFGGNQGKRMCDQMMRKFKTPFEPAKTWRKEELVIIGSGPAAMEIAYKALKDGIRVRMYEKSDKPGGLLADGIPSHKFDKTYIKEDFDRLEKMGLKLFLNSEIVYEASSNHFKVKGTGEVVATGDKEKQRVVLCAGAGKPKALPEKITEGLTASGKEKIIQAVDFLKAANDIAALMEEHKGLDIDSLIKEKLGVMDPRGKKIVVIGGGDTAQDAIRWAAKYLQEKGGDLTVITRGPGEQEQRGIKDAYPSASHAKTKENHLRDEEMEFIGAKAEALTTPVAIREGKEQKLKLEVRHDKLVHYDTIQKQPELKKLYDRLPREAKTTVFDPTRGNQGYSELEADLVICALGFEGQQSIPLAKATSHLRNVDIAGDAAESQNWIIVGAQKSASDTYENRIKKAFGVSNEQVAVKQVLVGV